MEFVILVPLNRRCFPSSELQPFNALGMEDIAKAHLNSWFFFYNSIHKEAHIFQKYMLRRMMVYVDWRRQKNWTLAEEDQK